MKARIQTIRGSRNVYRDTNRPYADVEQLEAILAAEIIKRLDKEEMSMRTAHAKTGLVCVCGRAENL
jgi:hypothetical protein